MQVLKRLIFSLIIFLTCTASAQLYNKEVIAKISIEDKSEFFTFTATAENLTSSDKNLRYQFFAFENDADNNVIKSGQENRSYLSANEIQVLATLSINSNFEGKIIVLLVIYDDEDRPIGQDRIEVSTINELKKVVAERTAIALNSGDQTDSQDGFTINGLVIQKTLTKAGRDFYKYFGLLYYNKKIKTAKNILIEEVPGFRVRTTLISVKVGNQLVWRFFSRPTRKFLEEMANTAIDKSILYMQQIERQSENLRGY